MSVMVGAPRLGDMRHLVEIQKSHEYCNSDGSIAATWETLAYVWAEIVPLSGSEDYVAQGLSASVVYRISTRYFKALESIVPKMQIVYGDRTFEIVAVRNLDERDRWLVMNCQENV